MSMLRSWQEAPGYTPQTPYVQERFGQDECRGGAWAWVPFVGCDWLAGAQEARFRAESASADWITGVRYLVNTGKQDGLYAALAEYSQGAIYAAAVASEWSMQEGQQLLAMVKERADKYADLRTKSDEMLDRVAVEDPQYAATLRATYRDDRYEQTWEGVEAGMMELQALLGTGAAWAQALQQKVTFGVAAPVAGAAAIPAIPATTLGVVAAICLTLIAALAFLSAVEMDLFVIASGFLEEQGLLPKGTTDKMLKGHAGRGGKGVAWAKAVPWVVAGIALVVGAPLIWEATAAFRMKRKLVAAAAEGATEAAIEVAAGAANWEEPYGDYGY